MNSGYAEFLLYMAMKNGSIAKADYPFWVFYKISKINFVNNPDCAVSATAKHNGLY